MRPRRPILALALTAAVTVALAPAAWSQVSLDPVPQSTNPELTTTPPVTPTTPTTTTPAAGTLPPASTTLPPAAGTAPAVTATTPAPPPYLVPGPDAASQPISTVVVLTDPDVPYEPIRIAALIAALIAVLGVGGALVLRNLGLRTLGPPVEVAPSRFANLRERPAMFADDLRDFLRRSR